MKKFIAIAVAIALLIAWISHSIFKRYDHPEQISLAVIQLELVGSNVELFFTDNGYLPESLDQLSYAGDKGPYLQTKQLKDPWGRLLFYRKDSDGKSFLLFTLGSDGRLGGSGHESDRQFEKIYHWQLTIRSSRPRVVASATCLRYASTQPPPRHGPA